MLSVNQISKSFNIAKILDGISFTLDPGEKAGLVGANGSGKTTLMRIIMGLETADSGSVKFIPGNLRPGYLAQGFTFGYGETVQGYINHCAGDLLELTSRLDALAQQMTRESRNGDLHQQYDDTLQQIARASENAGQVRDTLTALGLDSVPPGLPVAKLSGGQKTRLALAGILLARPQLLLLDEPTNHLDIAMLEWLEVWLAKYPGAALIVSHDRTFLDKTVTRILEIEDLTHKMKAYAGNYSAYLEQKEAARSRQWAEYHAQQAEIKRMKADILRQKTTAAYNERQASSIRIGGGEMKLKGMKDHVQGIAKKVAKKAKAREKKLERYMESGERVEKPRPGWEMKINFKDAGETGRDVIVLEHLTVGYPGLILLEDINLKLRYGSRVALIGANGSGKTTLLKTIIGELQPLSGKARLGARVKVGYMSQEHAELKPALNPLTTIQSMAAFNETEARSFLSKYLFKGDDVFTPVGSLSFGERARLILAGLVAQGCNFLMLDEPTNHLDIPSRSQFEQALAEFKGTVMAV
ncbi:MAG: ABC-F family ATP-binding cassette domain-containing protein, partial [Anaerolineales bacterium]|nr:ABC-F family ATP-binding cassette domain-containing protein [Anaerolineales bacterium]